MIKLERLNGTHAGEHRSFSRSPVTLGRETDCDWILAEDGKISRHHALIGWTDEKAVLRDLGAKHPTLINGSPFAGDVLLESGDTLCLGETMLKFLHFQPPRPARERRYSWMEWGTALLALLALLAQLYFLSGIARHWRGHVEVPALRMAPAEATPVPEPTPKPAGNGETEEVDIPEHLRFATPTPLPPPTPTPIPQTELLSPGQQLQLARQLVAERRLLDADRLLVQVLDLNPNHLEARAELARLHGRRSMFRESHAEWLRVRDQAEPGSELALEAAREIPVMDRRAALLEQPAPTPLPIPTPAPRPTAAPPAIPTPRPEAPRPPDPVARNPALLLENIQMQRLEGGSLFQELRLFQVNLRHVTGMPAVPAGAVSVEAVFYEALGDQIVRAAIPNQVVRMRINEELGGGRVVQGLEVAYEVPAQTSREGNRRFHGVVFRVLKDGGEIHTLALPASLLLQR